MSLAASQRRDQRRRLVLSWNRSGSTASPTVAEPRRLADYSSEALPERQPALATLLPTGLGGFALAAAALLSITAAAIGIGVWETVTGTVVFSHGTVRFAATLAALRQSLDLRSFLSLGGWLAQMCLVVATASALVVRLMRRHRRDDYRGRYRAWGWLAGLFMVTACAGHVPLGPIVSAFMSDATGITLGPAGIGWWVLAASLLYAAIGLWAVLPLHERAATGTWLTLCLLAWASAAACHWLGNGRELHLVIGNACWMAGAALAAIAMLAAARSVIREVRGLPARKESRHDATSPAAAQAARKQVATRPETEASDDNAESAVARDEDREQDRTTDDFVDGSESVDAEDEGEQAGRHLSKAERKRLKKLARMNRAA